MPNRVFISPSTHDARAADALCCELEGAGIACWIAPRNVPPGRAYSKEIISAIEQAPLLLLVLTRQSDDANNVLQEVEAAWNQKIPVIAVRLEDCELKGLKYYLGAFQWINAFRGTLSSHFPHIIEAVQRVVDERDGGKTPKQDDRAEPDLRVVAADIDTVLSWNWDGPRLLDALIELDFALFGNQLTDEHEGNTEQWHPVFMDHPDTWRLLINPEREIVGYWHYVPLFDEDHQAAREGRLVDSEITTDRVRLFELPGTYDIYFVSISLKQRYRKPAVVRTLVSSLLDVWASLAEDGVFINEICANAFTDNVVSWCRTMEMRHVCNHHKHGRIYVGRARDLLKHQQARHHPEFRRHYAREGV